MDERGAFRMAVKMVAAGNWDPAYPERQPINVDGAFLSPRQVCERARGLSGHLLEEIKEELYRIFHRASDLDLQGELRIKETYSVGADCLLKYIDRRLAERRP